MKSIPQVKRWWRSPSFLALGIAVIAVVLFGFSTLWGASRTYASLRVQADNLLNQNESLQKDLDENDFADSALDDSELGLDVSESSSVAPVVDIAPVVAQPVNTESLQSQLEALQADLDAMSDFGDTTIDDSELGLR